MRVADVLVHHLVERLLHDGDGRLVGDAQAVDKIRLQAADSIAGDGLAAAVHHDDVDADRGEERDVVATRVRIVGSGSSMKLPPYFTTKVEPWKSWMYGSASSNTAPWL
jgi:hypothetical protein